MTGYGRAEVSTKKAEFIIEIKSLNSKQIDIQIKMLSLYREKEIELRKLIAEKLRRGKIELSIWREKLGTTSNYKFNTNVVRDYYQQLDQLKKDLKLKSTDILPSLLKMPDVLEKSEEKVDTGEWQKLYEGIGDAINNLLQFRVEEGKNLEQDIRLRINNISELLLRLDPLTNQRIVNTRKKILDKLTDIDLVDENRLEQELIYYLEKQDITEEQIRLQSHLDYFINSIEESDSNGKKLVFISQEMGREINTIGSKSSNSEMQKIVVEMKDELEKIKEQLLNIL
tara:strand:- start:592 stop:1443 length:852 start_codon:yes stop_codon:yes gene_type:complete